MRERKPYPNISDEELDRRAEEALKRMLAKQHPATGLSGGQPSGGGGQQQPRQGQRHHRRKRR